MTDVSPEKQRKQRAAARRSWCGRRYRISEDPSDDLTATMTPEQQLASLRELTSLRDLAALALRDDESPRG